MSNCNLQSVDTYHGVSFLDIKQKKLIPNKSNKNDIIDILGPPSSKNFFENDIWIYIEKKNTKSSLIKLGKNKEIKSNFLVLEIDNYGLLKTKKLYTIDDQKELKFNPDETKMSEKDSFVYGVFSSLKQKIDNPKRKKK